MTAFSSQRTSKRTVFAVLLLLCLVVALSLLRPVSADDSDDSGSGSDVPADTTSVTDSILGGGPQIGAQAAVVMEINSGAVLFSKNAGDACSPMSLTKLMTALVTLNRASLSDPVSFSYKSIHGIGNSVTRIGMVEDERIFVSDALYGMLVASSDECAYALGESVGGTMATFTDWMNAEMKALGGIGSSFVGATGTNSSKEYSCAYDLGLVACELSKNPDFMKMASSKWYEIPATNKKEARMLAQTHKFVRQTKKYEFSVAGKSGGKSPSGQYSLCTYAEKDGMTVVAIVLGCANDDASYDDTVSILNYAFENYTVHPVKLIENALNENYTGLFDYCPMFDNGSGEIVYTDRNSSVVLPHGAEFSTLTKNIEYFDLPEYTHGENIIGQTVYLYNGRRVGRARIIFRNEEFPISQQEFDSLWPFFLVPPSMLESQGGTGVDIDNSYLTAKLTPIPAGPTPGITVTPTPTPLPVPHIDPPKDVKKGLFGNMPVKTKAILFGSVVFAVPFIAFCIFISLMSRRRKRKNRMTKRL